MNRIRESQEYYELITGESMSGKNKMEKCIYCLQNKPESDFNREHVISRMFGTYENALVLNHNEVCKECNTYFSKILENEVALDSYEALLRTQENNKKKHSTKRNIGKTRIKILGQNGIIKGLKLYISTDSDSISNIQITIEPAVGISKDAGEEDYDYYELDDVPDCSMQLWESLRQSEKPIIVFGYDKDEVLHILSQKNYDVSKMNYNNVVITDIVKQEKLLLDIRYKVDTVVSRLAAKNIFNFLCYKKGKDYVIDKRFDAFRSYIRYGDVNAKRYVVPEGIMGLPENENNGHIIGTAWVALADRLYHFGFVSWFNKITYSFVLDDCTEVKEPPDMQFAICDNRNRTIKEWKDPLFIDWPIVNILSQYLSMNSNGTQ